MIKRDKSSKKWLWLVIAVAIIGAFLWLGLTEAPYAPQSIEKELPAERFTQP